MGRFEGIEKGIEQGIEQGMERGIRLGLEAERTLLYRQVKHRFGPSSADAFLSRLQSI